MRGADIALLLPEAALALFALGALVLAALPGREGVVKGLVWSALILFGVLAAYFGLSEPGARQGFGGAVVDDALARFGKISILVSGGALLALSRDYLERDGLDPYLFPAFLSLAVLGAMLAVSAAELLLLCLGLELMALALYALSAMRRESRLATEAGLKFVLLGLFASALMFAGAGLSYGFAGGSLYGDLAAGLDGSPAIGARIGLALLISGLAFRAAAAPFHAWAPDVAEGAPPPVSALVLGLPLMAALVAMARLLQAGFADFEALWQAMLAALSLLSLIVAALAMPAQGDLKRLMGYGAILHAGFALMALAAGDTQGLSAMLVQMLVYLAMSFGMFCLIISMQRGGQHVTAIAGLKGLGEREPAKAVALALILMSLAGVPPLAGFFARLAVMRAALDAGLIWLVVAGSLAALIAGFSFLRLVWYIAFGEARDRIDPEMKRLAWLGLMAAAALMLIAPAGLIGLEDLAQRAADSLGN